MFNIEKKASILRAVAAGGTLKKAGEAVGISAGQAGNRRLCCLLDGYFAERPTGPEIGQG